MNVQALFEMHAYLFMYIFMHTMNILKKSKKYLNIIINSCIFIGRGLKNYELLIISDNG